MKELLNKFLKNDIIEQIEPNNNEIKIIEKKKDWKW